MPVLCARLLIDCSTLSAPCLEPELRLIHRSRAKSRQVRRSSSESGSGLNVHEELRSHHLERRGGANGDSWPVSGGCIHSLPVRSCRKIRGSKKKCLQKRGEFVPACARTTAPRAEDSPRFCKGFFKVGRTFLRAAAGLSKGSPFTPQAERRVHTLNRKLRANSNYVVVRLLANSGSNRVPLFSIAHAT